MFDKVQITKGLNPFFFRARLQHIVIGVLPVYLVLIPFSSGLGCSEHRVKDRIKREVLIPFSSGLGCSMRACAIQWGFRVLIPFSSGLGCSFSWRLRKAIPKS